MSKSGLLQFAPILGGAAALAAPFLAPALFGAEAAGIGGAEAAGLGAAEAGAAGAVAPAAAGIGGAAAGLGEAGALTLPEVTVTAPALSAGIGSELAGAAGLAGGVVPFLTPGSDTPLPSGVTGIDAGTITPSEGLPAATTTTGEALPSSPFSAGLGPPEGTTDINTFLTQPTPTDLTAATTPASTAPQAPIDPGFGAAPTDSPIFGTAGTDAAVAGDLLGQDQGFFSDVGDWFNRNQGLVKGAGTIASLGGLGYQLLNAPEYPTAPAISQIPGATPVSDAATTATTNAANLMTEANQNLTAPLTGGLPAGAESAIQNSTNAAKAKVRSSFASMGIPAGSSMEAEALAAVDQQAGTQRLTEAQSLANLGVQEAQLAGGQSTLASTDLTNLMDTSVKLAIQRQQDLQTALANFSRALAGPATATHTINLTS